MERFTLFCDAYGLPVVDRAQLLQVGVQRTRRMWQALVDNADREPYSTLVREGHANFWKRVEKHVIGQSETWSNIHA